MDFQGNSSWWINTLPSMYLVYRLAILAATVYAFVLFVRFANLGIKAFKIYIDKNRIQG